MQLQSNGLAMLRLSAGLVIVAGSVWAGPTLAQCTCQGNPVGQANFPLTPASGQTYCLVEDVVVPTGTAISASGKSNWKLGLNGRSITFAESGFGRWADLSNGSGAQVCGGTIKQGAWTGQPDAIVLGVASGAVGLTLDGLTVSAVGVGSGSNDFLWLSGGDSTSVIRNSIFYLSGQNRVSLTRGFAGKFLNNDVNVQGLKGAVAYARIIENPAGSEIAGNRFLVDVDSTRVNLVVAWAQSNVSFHDNIVNWAQSGAAAAGTGRVFIIDAGSRNWSIKNNQFFISSPVETNGDQYLFRIRVDQASAGVTSDIEIANNVIDSSRLTGTDSAFHVLSVGPSTQTISFHHNRVVGRGTFAGTYEGANSGFGLYCNAFEHSGAGYPLSVGALTSAVNWNVANNRFSVSRADGIVVNDRGTGSSINLCANDGLSSTAQIGGTNEGVQWQTASCPLGTTGCWQSAGLARVAPQPPGSIIVN